MLVTSVLVAEAILTFDEGVPDTTVPISDVIEDFSVE